jgi:2-dehydro-3-deoxy-D-arabinonate dehydratase
VGLLLDQTIVDLTPAGITDLTGLLESGDAAAALNRLASPSLPRLPRAQVRLLCPLERQEVWAAGVTYTRSKQARMEESTFSATAYDRVYEAERPELFFKALPEKVSGPGEPIGVRRDSRWTVPEPELALVLNSRGIIAGYTLGNDVSARDLEGDNLLYLPQAKIYDRSCALGPAIAIGLDEPAVRSWQIELQVQRGGAVVFAGATPVGRIKRGFGELAAALFRCQRFPQGAVLLTGTGIVPPDEFALQPGDETSIHAAALGTLTNRAHLV